MIIATKYANCKPVTKLIKECSERVDERLIGLNILPASDCVEEYLRRFGRNISAAKCAALAIACENRALKNETLCGLTAAKTNSQLLTAAEQFLQEAERLGGIQ
jgi:hypothetical protein